MNDRITCQRGGQTDRRRCPEPGDLRWAAYRLLPLLGVLAVAAGCSGRPEPPNPDAKGRVAVQDVLGFLKKTALGRGKAFVARVRNSGEYSSGFEHSSDGVRTSVTVFHLDKDVEKHRATSIVFEREGERLPEMPAFRKDCELCVMALGREAKAAEELVTKLWNAQKRSYLDTKDSAKVFEWRLNNGGLAMIIMHRKYKNTQLLYFAAEPKK